MKVTLLSKTEDPTKVVAAAAKLCYSDSDAASLMENLTDENIEKFVNKLQLLGHESPFEHVSFTFGIDGISRACSHQLVRHRIASYSQQSQRYVNMKDFKYVIPPSIENNTIAKDVFRDCMETITDAYNVLLDLLTTAKCAELYGDDHIYCSKGEIEKAKKLVQEDARFVLPNACETNIVMTMNVRSLYNFFKLRCCNRAQWEIRNVAMEMYKLVYATAPVLFEYCGPTCVTKHVCSEGMMTCGNPDKKQQEFVYIKESVKNADNTSC